VYWLRSTLTNRRTALEISRGLERLLGGSCQVGDISIEGVSRLTIRELIVFNSEGTGELFSIDRADVLLRMPECLWGRALLESVVLHAPAFEFDSASAQTMIALLGGAVRAPKGAADVLVKAGTLRFVPLARAPDFALEVGPLDLLMIPPEGERRPILRANTNFNGAPFEVFAEYFTAPKRVRLNFFLADTDVSVLPGLSQVLGDAFSVESGTVGGKGELVVTERGRELNARLKVKELVVLGRDGSKARLNGTIQVKDGRLVTVKGFEVAVDGIGTLVVKASVSDSERLSIDAMVSSPELSVAALAPWMGPERARVLAQFGVEGTVAFDGRVLGQLIGGKLDWSGTARLDRVVLAPTKDVRLTGGTMNFDRAGVSITGMEGVFLGGKFAGTAKLRYAETAAPLALNLRVANASVGKIVAGRLSMLGPLKYLAPIGTVDFDLTAQGPLPTISEEMVLADTVAAFLDAARVAASCDLSGVRLSVAGLIDLVSMTGSVVVANDQMQLQGVKVVTKGMEVVLEGTVASPFNRPVAECSYAVRAGPHTGIPLDTFIAVLRSHSSLPVFDHFFVDAGTISLSGTVRGALRQLRVFGELEYERARLKVRRSKGEPIALGLGSGRIAFDQESAWTDDATLSTPLGDMAYTGRVKWPAKGPRQLHLDLCPVSKTPIDARLALSVLAPERTPPVPVASTPGFPVPPDPLAGATVRGSASLDGAIDDPKLACEFVIGLPSGTEVRGDGTVSELSTTRFMRVDLAVHGGQGVPVSLARALLPELSGAGVDALLDEGSLTGDLTVEGPPGTRSVRGKLVLDLNKGQNWELLLGEGVQTDGSLGFTARCERGRIERILALLPWPGARKWLARLSPRLPFSGALRWRVSKAGDEHFSVRIKLLRGAFDIPEGLLERESDTPEGMRGAPTVVSVLDGALSLDAVRSTTGTQVRGHSWLKVRSPFQDIDPAPFVFRLEDVRYENSDVHIGAFRSTLFGETVAIRGRIEKVDTLGKLKLEAVPVELALSSIARKVFPENAYYQKGVPLTFDTAKVAVTLDDLVFSPFPIRLGLKNTTFPVDGSLKQAFKLDNVWIELFRNPRVMWRRLIEFIGKLDTQKVLGKYMGVESYGTILRSGAHRIRINLWTETRSDEYVYDAFLTDLESQEFLHRDQDIVRRYELIAKRALATREGFSPDGFGVDAFKMLRITKVTSSVLDRHGNQVWPEAIPKWRLDRTKSER